MFIRYMDSLQVNKDHKALEVWWAPLVQGDHLALLPTMKRCLDMVSHRSVVYVNLQIEKQSKLNHLLKRALKLM